MLTQHPLPSLIPHPSPTATGGWGGNLDFVTASASVTGDGGLIFLTSQHVLII